MSHRFPESTALFCFESAAYAADLFTSMTDYGLSRFYVKMIATQA